MLGDESFREFRCDWCAKLAYICPADDRGQIYCSDNCREAGTSRRGKAAQACYRADPLVREDHRDYMREWRRTRGQAVRFVRDRGLKNLALLAKQCVAPAPAATTDVAHASGPRS